MKKWLIAFSITALLLTACGGENNTEENYIDFLNVNKGIVNVDVTLPVSFFIGSTEEEIIAKAKENGIIETVINKDGLATFTMSKSQYNEMMEEIGNSIVSTIDEIVNSGDYMSIKEISYNEDYTEFHVKVNRQQYEAGFDGFAIMGLVIVSTYYSAFEGNSREDLKTIFNMVDETTGEIYDTAIYPDDWEQEAK